MQMDENFDVQFVDKNAMHHRGTKLRDLQG